MFEYIRTIIASRFDHPILGFMFVVAGALSVGGIVVETMIRIGASDWRLGAGFLAVFAVFFALVGLIGYSVLYLGKLFSVARDRMGPTS